MSLRSVLNACGISCGIACGLLLAATSATSQTLRAIKFPTGDVVSLGGGVFTTAPDSIIRWQVVLDNRAGATDVTLNYLDMMDPAGVRSCGGDPPCPGAEELELLCTGADAPDPATGTVFVCDPPSGMLDIRGVTVPAGGTTCLGFTTRVRPTALNAGIVQNIGCIDVIAPFPQSMTTFPTNSAAPACAPPATSAPVAGCSQVRVLGTAPPSFEIRKTATFDDTNGNGVLNTGERITWSVVVSNTGTEDQRGWLYDEVPSVTSFVDITLDPGCTLVGNQIECLALDFTPGETKTLEFRTDVTCAALTPDDSADVCNQARICADAAQAACFPSDPDGVAPTTPTCVPFPNTDFTSSTKTWTFLDQDSDGGLSDGDRLIFTITLRDDGRLPGTGLSVTDVLDTSCIDIASLDPGSGAFDGIDTLTFPVPDLAIGEPFDLTFSADAIGTGPTCCNQALIFDAARTTCALAGVPTDDPSTGAPGDATCPRFGPQPILEVTKDFVLTDDINGNGVVDDGDEIEFIVTVVNSGAGVATAVRLEDLLARCWEPFDPATVIIEGGGVDGSLPPPNPPIDGGQVIVDELGGSDGIAGGGTETVVVRWRLRLASSGGTNTCCNRARVYHAESASEILSDDPDTAFFGDATCTTRLFQDSVLEVTKTAADQDADGCFEPGEQVTYTITVTARDETAHAVQLVDALDDPSNMFTVLNTGFGVYSALNDEIAWDLDDIPRGDTRVLTWIGRLECTAPDGAPFADLATAVALNAPPSSEGVASTASAPEIRLTLTVDFDPDLTGALEPNETVTATLLVENIGSCVARDVVVRTDLDADIDEGTLAISAGGIYSLATREITWDGASTPLLAALNPGASQTLVFSGIVLDPASNPRPGRDGIATVEGSASVPGDFTCPIDESVAPQSEAIAVATAFLQLSESVTDFDGDGCFEPGEAFRVKLTVTARNSGGDGGTLVMDIDDASDAVSVTDPGTGTLEAAPERISWALGLLGVDAPLDLVWDGVISCDATDLTPFRLLSSTSGGDFPRATSEFRGNVGAPVLSLRNIATWDDDGDGVAEPGEVMKYEISVTNLGSCAARAVTIVDFIDADLDRSAVISTDSPVNDGNGNFRFDPLTTPVLTNIDPLATRTVALEAPILDPATNPDPTHDGFIDNFATMIYEREFTTCPGVVLDQQALRFQINLPPDVTLLRSDFISCREDAFTTMRLFMRQRPEPQACSEPTAIDPFHPGTQVVSSPTSPWPFAGDADPAASFPRCPQSGFGFGRILVFYEVDEPSPACLITLRVAKSGSDVLVSW